MSVETSSVDRAGDPQAWRRLLVRYREPRIMRSLAEIVVTAVPFAFLWTLTWIAVSAGYWVGLVLALPAAGFLVRLFMIQHDCSHGSFFRSRPANNWVGRVIGVLTLTPYDLWRHSHAIHHASSGHLDRPSVGGIDTLTVREYQGLSWHHRLRYRLYRHPLVLFGIGPAYIFLLDHRLPVGFMRSGWMPWVSTMSTNMAIIVVAAGVIWLVGVGDFLLVQLPITLLASVMGVWLFYVQHQFEETYWEHEDQWEFHEAAFRGSSHYALPGMLRWFSANIGVHHVHHLCSRIPSYRLGEVLRDYPELRGVGRITLRQSLAAVSLALWDERQRRLISFRERNETQSATLSIAARAPAVGQPEWQQGRRCD
ncbi:omega-6 fatty acid desaturase (delta-12 desaturase) [Natronocella acetinitrilica]|uniref:Omega-6 fatty acid desaturase (Delta-12 desaturase) n=1 Tax=Natronocella acetinitrilica TaxID=414046 RepID=A0AAE3KGP0_9GAMM|nr:fatty acid desaturase [Natronocella acetinitrilica]MCP1675427.1 omega-6 fatty acid desaturase (delta-12 desaturase) [Natronocella acetinitrilica]